MPIIGENTTDKIKLFFFDYIYPDNSHYSVKKKLRNLLTILDQPGATALNIGAGSTRLHPKIKNLDIIPGNQVDIIGNAENIPVKDEYFDLIVTQNCLEHVKNPEKVIYEIYRLLKKGGKVYIQLPFIIGYHPGPNDFWRFTTEGIEELICRNNLKLIEKGTDVGCGTGYYRISVEFFAVLLSVPFNFLYKPLKLIFAILLSPIKLTDFLFSYSLQKDRIAGGYFLIAQK